MSTQKVTLAGGRYSPFFRVMQMALFHLKIDYEVELLLPHSKYVYQYNPFGRIPLLIHGEKAIYETTAIRDYIDSKFNSELTPVDFEIKLKVTQFISVASDYLFRQILVDYIKQRLYLERLGKTEGEITVLLEKKLKGCGRIMKAVESMVEEGPFLCGEEVTWADYFVYPFMVSFYSFPEASFFSALSPKLFQWYGMFGKRPEAVATAMNIVDILRRASL
ncbi:hypothetical protein INT47_001592 [Mucor saturninus]|uniref:Glutathione S-transferase n=1 Tax=Mucor saturninus TaxID=64648 RepID=A0A8H7QIL1_9FUNG|nr:hypothetical protein INT47_001592 [Mucor saturninus]